MLEHADADDGGGIIVAVCGGAATAAACAASGLHADAAFMLFAFRNHFPHELPVLQ